MTTKNLHVRATRFCSLIMFWLLAACGGATTPQRQTSEADKVYNAAFARGNECQQANRASPEGTFISERLPIRANEPATMSQLSNRALPTQADLRILSAWHEEHISCRQHFLEALRGMSPVHVGLQQNFWSRVDIVYAALMRREISWGTAAERIMKERGEMDLRWAEANQTLQAQRSAAAQAEARQREAAWAAFSASMAQANALQNQQQMQLQQSFQQQQILNNLNRPRQTNCFYLGNNLHCTTN